MRWRKVTLIGVGLLGGSLGLALKSRALAQRVTGYVRRESSIDEVIQAGAVDDASCDLREAVAEADLIVLCTPLWQMGALARSFGAVEKGAIVTDVGSVKKAVVNDLEPFFAEAGAWFVGSHPMAGSERMGVSAARADLFENACCVVTPGAVAHHDAVAKVEQLWTDVGAQTLRMNPDQHDELVARSSHLPHVLAAHLAAYVLAPEFPPEQPRLCAGGFKDSTRIASGSPEMWRDIVTMNRDHVARALADFQGALDHFRAALQRNDSAEIENIFRTARSRRNAWVAPCPARSSE